MDRSHLAAACFLGAAVTMFTLLFGFTSIGAWIVLPAALMGGVSAWLSYKPSQISTGLRYAAKLVPEVPSVIKMVITKPPMALWGSLVWLFKRPQMLTAILFTYTVLLHMTAITADDMWFNDPGAMLIMYVLMASGFSMVAMIMQALLVSIAEFAIGRFRWVEQKLRPYSLLSSQEQSMISRDFWAIQMSWTQYVVQMLLIVLGLTLMPLVLLKGVWWFTKHLFRFMVAFLTFTHSSQRIICMIDGPLGGFAGFGILYAVYGADSFTLPLWMQGLSVLGAAIIGATIGLLNDTLIKTRVIPRLEAAVAYLHPDLNKAPAQS